MTEQHLAWLTIFLAWMFVAAPLIGGCNQYGSSYKEDLFRGWYISAAIFTIVVLFFAFIWAIAKVSE